MRVIWRSACLCLWFGRIRAEDLRSLRTVDAERPVQFGLDPLDVLVERLLERLVVHRDGPADPLTRVFGEFDAELAVLVERLRLVEHGLVDAVDQLRVVPIVHLLECVLVRALKLVEVVRVLVFELLRVELVAHVANDGPTGKKRVDRH